MLWRDHLLRPGPRDGCDARLPLRFRDAAVDLCCAAPRLPGGHEAVWPRLLRDVHGTGLRLWRRLLHQLPTTEPGVW